MSEIFERLSTAVLEGEVQRFLTTNPGSRQKR